MMNTHTQAGRYTSSRLRLPLLALLLALLLAACGGGGPNAGNDPVELVEVTATSSTSLRVVFSAAVGPGAENPENYRVTDAAGEVLDVLAAYLSRDGTMVTLATEHQNEVPYTLTIQGIKAATGAVGNIRTTGRSFGGSGEKAPIVASAIALGNTRVLVTFAEPNSGKAAEMSSSALNIDYYDIIVEGGDAGQTPDLMIKGITFANNVDHSRVILETEAQQDRRYTVKVTNVVSAHGGKLLDPFNNTAGFNGIPVNDTEDPKVLSAAATSNTTVLVSFSEPVGEKAGDASSYTITDEHGIELAVIAADLNEFHTQVTLITEGQRQGTHYTVEVNGIEDLAGNPIAGPPDNSATFTGLNVSNDENALPEVSGAGATDSTHVVVTFTKPMDKVSLENRYHYRISTIRPDEDPYAALSTQATVTVLKAEQIEGVPTAVKLTTLPQAGVRYYIKVTNVVDTDGNQLAPKRRGYDPSVTSFIGIPPSAGDDGAFEDSDGDGLSDFFEGKGWTVTVTEASGQTSQSQVTSDPFEADTDGDGLDDYFEVALVTNPRSGDSDGDKLSDAQEFNQVYSEPTMQDSDGDGLFDGLEFNFFKTSPLLADTDGDQFADDYEVVIDNRNPRLADLPRVEIVTGNVDLQLDVRFEEQTSQGTTTLDSKSISTSLAQARSDSTTQSNSQTKEWFWKVGGSVGFTGGTKGGKAVAVLSTEFSAEGGQSGSTTSSFTAASSRATQREYATSLTTNEQVTAESRVTRHVEGAAMAVAVNLRNAGNIAFTISDIEITALIQDPRDPTVFVPVATLFAASSSPVSVGPLTPERGPFRFTADEVFPKLVESLMQNPRGLLFKVASYRIVDEFGREFAFVEQDVNDRTVSLEIDYSGNLPLERFQAATNSSFDANGDPLGVTMHDIMQNILGLERIEDETVDEALTACFNANSCSDEQFELFYNSYSTRVIDGVETLFRVRRVSEELPGAQDREWWVITPQGYDPGLAFSDIVTFSDQNYAFKFVQDLDADFLEADQEGIYRSIDSDLDTDEDPDNPDSKDTDNDGIDDGDEVFGYLKGDRRIGWTVQLQDGQDAYRTFSNPARADTDLDGLTDCQELILGPDGTRLSCAAIEVYLTLDGVPTLGATDSDGNDNTLTWTLRPEHATDPSNPDTDGDGLTDAMEIAGFSFIGLTGDSVIVDPDTDPDTDYASNPLSKDTDGDGLADFLEVRLGTNPVIPDGDSVRDDDGDGLVNLRETTGWDVEWKDASGQHTHRDTSDPEDPDSDDDGLSDWEEFMGCRDRDRDLVCDSEERFGSTRPKFADTDSDGLTDREEVDSVDFPGDLETPFRFTDPRDGDTDGDGRTDGEEVTAPWIVRVVGEGPYEVYSDPLDDDADNDTLRDGDELSLGSDPDNFDTDGDGASDALEDSRDTNVLEADHLVTVIYRSWQPGPSDTPDADCSDGHEPGQFNFNFRVRKPGASFPSTVVTNSSLDIRECGSFSDTSCRLGSEWGTSAGFISAQVTSVIYVNETTSFAVSETENFTIGGYMYEMDNDDDGNRVIDNRMVFYFGGPGDPDGVYNGADLREGVQEVEFEKTDTVCKMRINVGIRVE